MKIIRVFSAAFLLIAFASCATIPPLATITSGEKSVDLVVNKDRIKTSGFSNIQRAVLSPDKRYILLVTDSSKHILFDCGREVIVKDDAKTEKMLAIKTPWCNQGMHCYYKDLQFVGPVPRYRVDIKCYAQPGFSESDNKQRTMATPDLEGMWGTICGIELVDTLTTDKIEKIEREIIIKNWYFSRDKLVVYFYNPLFHQNYHCLQFYNLSDLKEALKLKIKVNAALGYGFSSMSSDANTSILLFHNNRLIQFFDFKTMKYLGCLLMIDDKNWFAASSTGEYDGTDESLDFFQWDLGGEKVPVNKFDRSFRNRGLLAQILNPGANIRSEASRIDLAGQLIGKVREIKGGEIIVSSGRAAETMKMGDRVFVIIDGQKAVLEVKFPMQTIAKCAVAPASAKFRDRIAAGMPVFK